MEAPRLEPSTRVLSDGGAVLVALGAGAGALWAHQFPRWAAIALVGIALLTKRSVVLVIGVMVLTSSLAVEAHRGLERPTPDRIDGAAVLLGDPRPIGRGARVDVRVAGRRYEAVAFGAAGARISRLPAGQRIHVRGSVQPTSEDDRRWHVPRHVAGRLTVDEALGRPDGGGFVARLANGFRRNLQRGADAADLPSADRALLLGLVVGDDRGQTAEVRDDFLASGLTHLLAVSGQNIAFVLVVAGPLLRRGGLTRRLVTTLAVLVVFGTVTRWEPSVTRAIAMATIASLGLTFGRPVAGLRLLALAVTALMVVDPLLVHRVGFLLSVGASAGIVLFGQSVASKLPGPRWFRESLAITVAAQIGVAPILIPTFGAMPLASIPANLVAGPVAGLAMVWGLVAGSLAGLVPGLGVVLHLPTQAATGWLATVAATMADAGLPSIGGRGAAVTATGAVGLLVTIRTVRGARGMSRRPGRAGVGSNTHR